MSSASGLRFSTMLTTRASAAVRPAPKSERSFSVDGVKNPFLFSPHGGRDATVVFRVIEPQNVKRTVDQQPRQLPLHGYPESARVALCDSRANVDIAYDRSRAAALEPERDHIGGTTP